MINNYLKIALRTLRKHAGYTVLNVAGLTIGMAACLLILLYVADEWSYDQHHEQSDRIYRVAIEGRLADRDVRIALTPAPLAETLVEQMPAVQAATRLQANQGDVLVRHGEQQFIENGLAFADSSVFQVFTVPLVQGEPQTALAEPNTVVLSASMAQKYFGREDPVGQVLTVNDVDYRVTGVMEDMPPAGHFQFDFLRSLSTLSASRSPSWLASTFYTYVLLNEKAEVDALAAGLPGLVRRYVGPQLKEVMGLSFSEFVDSGGQYEFFVQPLTDIHLHSHLEAEIQPNGDATYVYILSVVAVFILLIACINFTNLATARAMTRGREVGLRKVVGAHRRQLIQQFLSESILVSALALLLAVSLVELALPFFNQVSGKALSIPYLEVGWVLPGFVGLILVVGLLAGGYPAFVLSSFRPTAMLRGEAGESGRSGARLRGALVVFQFALSIILIIGTTVVARQLDYVQTKSLGFDEEHVVTIERAGALDGQAEAFKQQVLDHPGIVSVSVSSNLPGKPLDNTSLQVEDGPPDAVYPMRYFQVDYDFADMMDMDIAAGRFFSRDIATDSSAIIINEAAVRAIGWEQPLSKRLVFLAPDPADNATFTVVGVVKDFHFQSLRQEITPLAFFLDPPFSAGPAYVSVRVRPDDPGSRPGQTLAGTLAFLEKTWQRFAPDQPFQYAFLDRSFDALYAAERRQGRLFGAFTGLAVVIACLGLFGLAAYVAEQRTKEIGIRKVLGASVSGLVALLSQDFLKLVGLAFVLAAPVAYLAADRWLNDFAYRIEISWWIFLLAGSLALAVALLTVSYQAIRTALANPVESLRSE